MKSLGSRLRVAALSGLVVCLGWGLAARVPAAEPSDESLMASAGERIEKNRKADATVTVRDAAGKPVEGAKVAVRQTGHAFLFGCNLFRWGRQEEARLESAYRDQFAGLLNYATLAFYWPSYEPERGQPQHERTFEVARWCQEQGILAKGHPLAWNYSDADWFPTDTAELRRLQMERIDDCVSRFAGLIDRWDVVNEATHFDRDEFMKQRAPRHSAMWKATGRMEFTRECFEHARKAGPKATLLINDYRVDPAYEEVIEKLVDDQGQRMYDVIGIQSHMHGGARTSESLWETCERFSRFSVPLHFTEMTIVSGERVSGKARGESWPTTPEGEAKQAREVERVYTLLFSHPSVEAITWWDFSDLGAWQGAPAGLVRKDMTPKPAYEALLKLVKDEWWTRLTVETDESGRASFRGFLGDYEVEVSVAGRAAVRAPLGLAKGAGHAVEVILPATAR
ncbi:MAG: endo-1,4-beta-xylanase [Thermoguttaceae bacterium]